MEERCGDLYLGKSLLVLLCRYKRLLSLRGLQAVMFEGLALPQNVFVVPGLLYNRKIKKKNSVQYQMLLSKKLCILLFRQQIAKKLYSFFLILL